MKTEAKTSGHPAVASSESLPSQIALGQVCDLYQRTRVREKAPLAQLAELPMVAVVRHKALLRRGNGTQTVMLVARWIKTNNRANIPASADKALRKPALIALVAHSASIVARTGS